MVEPVSGQRPFAVFDIDGTVLRWQLYHAIADELAHRGYIDPDEFEKVRAVRMTWKRRTAENSFQDYERALVELIDKAIVGLSVQAFNQVCRHVIEEYRDQVYTYTRNLIRRLQADGYLLFAISASQVEIVGMFAQYYGFDDYGGTKYETADGKFTGHKSLILRSERKPELLEKLITKHGATRVGSIGVGDSESDIQMLSIVEQPIAFNPTKALFGYAVSQGWKVVLERKNMVYELEPGKDKDGPYVLAQTDGQ